MSKYKCPYDYPLTSRRKMAEYICNIGGYSSSNSGRFAIEFNVSAHNTDFGLDYIWDTYASEFVPDTVKNNPAEYSAYYNLYRELHASHEEHFWDWGVEDARRGLDDSEVYKMLWSGPLFDVKFGLYGRGGKHLCMSEFEGHSLRVDGHTLLSDMMRQTLSWGATTDTLDTLGTGAEWDAWTYKDIRNLYMMCRQWEVDFTIDKASKEVEYQGVFCLFANIVESAWEERKQEIADHEELVEAAQELWNNGIISLDDGQSEAFLLVCKAAGVSEVEAKGEQCGRDTIHNLVCHGRRS